MKKVFTQNKAPTRRRFIEDMAFDTKLPKSVCGKVYDSMMRKIMAAAKKKPFTLKGFGGFGTLPRRKP